MISDEASSDSYSTKRVIEDEPYFFAKSSSMIIVFVDSSVAPAL